MNKYCNAKNIKAQLDAYVMNQEAGTRAIAMAIAQHLRSIECAETGDLAQTDNVLVIGPSGCGKTETYRVLSRLERDFGCPVAMYNALDYAPTGSWKGSSVSNIFKDIFKRATSLYDELGGHEDESPEEQKDAVIKIAEHAIIILDEIDKIVLTADSSSRQFSLDYQSNLLKIVEGNTYDLGEFELASDNDDESEKEEAGNVLLDSTHMMFIFMGAFTGIEDIVRWRLHREQRSKQRRNAWHDCYQETNIGFMADTDGGRPQDKSDETIVPSQDDIIAFGFSRELLGRLPIITVYKPLSEDSLVDIMLNCKTSAYRKYQARFRQNGHTLRCGRSALREIARIAIERGTGARGLMTVFSELLRDTQYEMSGDTRNLHCLLRGKDIRDQRRPLIRDVTAKHKSQREKYLRRMAQRLKRRRSGKEQ